MSAGENQVDVDVPECSGHSKLNTREFLKILDDSSSFARARRCLGKVSISPRLFSTKEALLNDP